MTIEEMEQEQERLHEKFEQLKSEIHTKWLEMTELSKAYGRLEDEINKIKGTENGG